MSYISDDHTDIGAYVLDLLEDQDKAAFEAHLATCGSCAAELRTLSPIAGMLSGLEPVHVPEDAVAAPADLLRRRAAASRRRVRWRVAVGTAACVAALGSGLRSDSGGGGDNRFLCRHGWQRGKVTHHGTAEKRPASAGIRG